MKKILSIGLIGLLLSQCAAPEKKEEKTENISPMMEKVAIYKNVKLTADLSSLSENEKKMIPLMIEASEIMDDLFWYEAYGERGLPDDYYSRSGHKSFCTDQLWAMGSFSR